MTRLPLETIDLLKQTLNLYNTIEINNIVVFTKELQYVGTFGFDDQQTLPELSEAGVAEYRKLVDAIGSNDKKLVSFDTGPSEKYICHVMDKFVVLYRLKAPVEEESDIQIDDITTSHG
ncbi:hypothetical protein CANMA_003876 [Candida margitis]|uniref:uncharacterized protein n=1 Tax=Candida margitis TaxID=1775924 RepID=UPI00222713BC|nr:uncharacterized protein CANMA_003876 [Candida margitis]KAI5961102.1 hypothetical protein CANMA_003876 [Candida margitis]